jgi:flagellar motility protein MotE (MotC chaperone)
MTRDEIKRLKGRSEPTAAPAPRASAGIAPAAAAAAAARPQATASSSSAPPVLPPDVPATILEPQGAPPAGAELEYVPMLLGEAALRFSAARPPVDVARTVRVLAGVPSTPGSAAWGDATLVAETLGARAGTQAPPSAAFSALPPEAAQARSYPRWKRELTDWLARTQDVRLFRSTDPAAVSTPDESERDFRIRLADLAREKRDARAQALRDKYAPRVARLEERVRRAEQVRSRESEQFQQQKVQGAISIGATILGAFLGSGARGSVGRATTAARGLGRARKEQGDVDRAEENLGDVSEKLKALQAEFETELAALEATFDAQKVPLEPVVVRVKKTEVAVQAVQLAWAPLWRLRGGESRPAWVASEAERTS